MPGDHFLHYPAAADLPGWAPASTALAMAGWGARSGECVEHD